MRSLTEGYNPCVRNVKFVKFICILQATGSLEILILGTYTGEDSWHSHHFVVFKKL